VRESNNRRPQTEPKGHTESTRDVTIMLELSDTKIRNAKPADKEYTLADGQGIERAGADQRHQDMALPLPVRTENLIGVDDVMESPKLAE
jgi:hypothetical protein